MTTQSKYKQQLKQFGLNPVEWVICLVKEQYLIFENHKTQEVQVMALVDGSSICELQLISF